MSQEVVVPIPKDGNIRRIKVTGNPMDCPRAMWDCPGKQALQQGLSTADSWRDQVLVVSGSMFTTYGGHRYEDRLLASCTRNGSIESPCFQVKWEGISAQERIQQIFDANLSLSIGIHPLQDQLSFHNGKSPRAMTVTQPEPGSLYPTYEVVLPEQELNNSVSVRRAEDLQVKVFTEEIDALEYIKAGIEAITLAARGVSVPTNNFGHKGIWIGSGTLNLSQRDELEVYKNFAGKFDALLRMKAPR